MNGDLPNMPSLEEELAVEQQFVDGAYEVLEKLRDSYRVAQRQVEAEGAWGSPQARTERDAKAAHYGDQAMRLEQIEDRLVFGRIDLENNQSLYIGRAGLPDSEGSRLLVDWRAPAARPFYQATAVSPAGIVRRRHISTHGREVRGIEDDVLDADKAAKHGLTFQGEGALMSALASAREGRMGDIVATIQAEQDAIIRAPSKGVVVVQGGPGTGKTAVALHRAAYLLYTHRETLERRGVLIVGPSRVFLKYIEEVLPSLGETGVVSITLGDLVPGIHTTKLDSSDVAHTKGKLAWVETLRAAVRDLQRLPKEDLRFSVGGRTTKLSRNDVVTARTRARRSGRPHNVARDSFALELVELLTERLAGPDSDPETLDWWRESVRGNRDIRREINLCWMPTSSTTLLRRLFSKPEHLRRVARGLTQRDVDLVSRPSRSEFTVSDVPLLDELEELLGTSDALRVSSERQRAQAEEEELERVRYAMESQNLGGGIVSAEHLAERVRGEIEWTPLSERALADRTWAYGHVVVDEAQDLSPMAWHALSRRCPSRSFTVVGDLDQARGHYRPKTWSQALGPVARGLEAVQILTISYRTPATIAELSLKVLEEVANPPIYPLRSARDVPNALADTVASGSDAAIDGLWEATQKVLAEEVARLDRAVGVGAGRIGIIVGDARATDWRADQRGESSLTNRVSLLSASAAKGLEFDTTILVEPEEILMGGPGDLFVAMTRSTRRLHSVRMGVLPSSWLETLERQKQS